MAPVNACDILVVEKNNKTADELRSGRRENNMPELQTEQANTHKSLVNFDQWSELARTDPEAFEQKRAEFIEQTIQRMPAHRQQRMRCLQWKIDRVRHQAANPMAACIKLSEMMWDSLVGPSGLREVLERLGESNFEPLPKAEVLELELPPGKRHDS